MRLSPLQSRLVASLAASCLLILLYLILFPPSFALASEFTDALPVVSDALDLSIDPRDPIYEPEFLAFDRSITGRAPEDAMRLINNEPLQTNIDSGSTQLFVFALPSGSSEEEDNGRRHELRGEHNASRKVGAGAGAAEQAEGIAEDRQGVGKRQAKQTVYISANTCDRPLPVDPSKTTQDAPQLTLFVSTSAENQAPGPQADKGSQEMLVFKEGAVMYSLDTDKTVYLGVYAPNVSDAFSTKPYNVKVVASTDDYYFSYNDRDDADLIWVDSDSQGALLITHNLTESTDPKVEAELMRSQPYVLFAHNKKDRGINGLKYSYCGLDNHAQIAATKDPTLVRTGMTKRGPGNLPKQQFFFTGLNSSAEYFGILAQDRVDGGHLTSRQAGPRRGARVFKATSFRTKSSKKALLTMTTGSMLTSGKTMATVPSLSICPSATRSPTRSLATQILATRQSSPTSTTATPDRHTPTLRSPSPRSRATHRRASATRSCATAPTARPPIKTGSAPLPSRAARIFPARPLTSSPVPSPSRSRTVTDWTLRRWRRCLTPPPSRRAGTRGSTM